MNSEPWRLGSRKSPMAVAQSGDVARLITERTGRRIEIVGVTTLGDRSTEHFSGSPRRAAALTMLRLERLVLGVSFPPALLDSAAASDRMVIRERGEADMADAARLGRNWRRGC